MLNPKVESWNMGTTVAGMLEDPEMPIGKRWAHSSFSRAHSERLRMFIEAKIIKIIYVPHYIFYDITLIYCNINVSYTFNKLGQLQWWQRIFQDAKRPKKGHVSDWQHKTDKQSIDLLKNEPTEPGPINLEDYIQKVVSQRYPDALGYKEEIGKDVTKMLKQVMH